MALRFNSRRANLAITPGFYSYKGVVNSGPPIFRSDNKSDKLAGLEKSILDLSHTNVSAFTPTKSILAFKYSKVDLIRILKIFLETKNQESKAKVSHKQSLNAIIPDIYFGKSHIDYYHLYQ